MEVSLTLVYQALKDLLALKPQIGAGPRVDLWTERVGEQVRIEISILNQNSSKDITVQKLSLHRVRDVHECVQYWAIAHGVNFAPSIPADGTKIRPRGKLRWFSVVPFAWVLETAHKDHELDCGGSQGIEVRKELMARVVATVDGNEITSKVREIPPSRAQRFFDTITDRESDLIRERPTRY